MRTLVINNKHCLNKSESKTKEQKDGFLSMLIGILGASLGNLLEGKGVIQASKRATATSQGQGTITAGEDCLVLPCLLTNFGIQRYQNVHSVNQAQRRFNLYLFHI